MKQKTEIFVLENERRQPLGLGKAWKAAGSSSRIPVACPSLASMSLYSLSLSRPASAFCSFTQLPSSGSQPPTIPLLTQTAFWLFINTVFFFSIPILNSWAKGRRWSSTLGRVFAPSPSSSTRGLGVGATLQRKLPGAHPCRTTPSEGSRRCAGAADFELGRVL